MDNGTRRRTPSQRRTDKATEAIPLPDFWGAGPTSGGGNNRASELVVAASEKWVPVLSLVVATGVGLTISSTRDGGAVALSLLTDSGPVKRYCAHADELEQALDALHAHLAAQL